MGVTWWNCFRCQLTYSLPLSPRPSCLVCNRPLVQAGAVEPPPPLPPRQKRVPPPGKDAPLKRSGAISSTKPPIDHYFNLYLPSLVQGVPVDPDSRHAVYRMRLARSKRFATPARQNGFPDAKTFIEQIDRAFLRLKDPLAQEGIVLKHIYCQVMDYRTYVFDCTSSGWCAGIAAYWMKHKRDGINVFPHQIYSDRDLETEKGAPIKLMSNQDKLIQHSGLMQAGGNRSIPIPVKNTLDYIAGGRHAGTTPAVFMNMARQADQIPTAARQFYRMLAPRTAPAEAKAADRFLVLRVFTDGDAHAMALDMEAVEFFDPAHGVFTAANRSRQKLVDFLFHKFHSICYPGQEVGLFMIIRIE